jgi:hypothetical protein
VIEFDNSDRAHECIKKVSHLYKVLKRTETWSDLGSTKELS